MDKQSYVDLICRLSDANGISGFEDDVVALIKEEASGLGQVHTDSMLNLLIERNGNSGDKPRVLLDCHTDEVGFMVRAIRPNGTLEFIQIGGWVPSNIPAHTVRVINRDNQVVQGLVGSKPPHFMTEQEKNKPLDIADMYIDIGARSAQEAMQVFKVGIGSPVVPDVSCSYDDSHDFFLGKAFDNRLGCAAVLAVLRELDGQQLPVDLVGGCASQEEVGIRGAMLTARVVDPDVAIVFEGSPADDTCLPEYAAQTCMYGGPMLRHIDSRMITNPRFLRYALDVASQHGIAVQEAVRTGGGTNGGSIHTANAGVPTIVIGLPVRYAHTHYGMASYADFQGAVALAMEIVKGLDAGVVAGF